jgi:hypothetical protein
MVSSAGIGTVIKVADYGSDWERAIGQTARARRHQNLFLYFNALGEKFRPEKNSPKEN